MPLQTALARRDIAALLAAFLDCHAECTQTRLARFVGTGDFPQGPANPFQLADVERIGEVVFLRYLAPKR